MLQDLPILFVDDEPEVLKALLRTVQHYGWPAESAPGPLAAFERLEAQEFSVVVSDFRMPKMDGIEFLARVREQWPDPERVLLTAFADEGALERGINEAGISRFLRKPWKREVLTNVLGQSMRESRIRREHAILSERLRNRNEELSYVNCLLQNRVDEGDRVITTFRRRWDVALNAISDSVIILGPDHHIEGANSAAANLAKTSAEEMEGSKCHSLLFGCPKPCNGCPLASGSGRLSVTRDKTERDFDARAYRLPGAGESFICIYRDITREVAFESEAQQMEKMAAIGRLAGGVAHEINNPLHGILSFVQLAQKPGVAEEKLERFHEVIYECAIRCRDIVHGLKDFSRQAKPTEEHVAVDVGEVVKKALVLFGSVSTVKISERNDAPDARCLGNRNQLQQVVVNLVQNAIDASPKGGAIEVSLARLAGELVVSVEDQGRGVPPELRERIFEPFFTTKPEGVGTGLGLAISHEIMREHKGTLRVATATLGGARFEARLPLMAQAETP
jgi:two-component system, NtrC family, sensor kinase